MVSPEVLVTPAEVADSVAVCVLLTARIVTVKTALV